jgi:pyrroloquinoline-quinone synthase
MSPQELTDRLHAVGEKMYHHLHPFHLKMHEGQLSRTQLQAWALNRYYYQSIIPTKDALIISRATDPEFRRLWRKRLEDHDGAGESSGGLEKWIRLAEATGVPRSLVLSEEMVLPGVRFAVDAYLKLVRERSFLEAVASSLTELFAGRLIALRIKRLTELYPYMIKGMDYFEARLTQAPADAAQALAYVCEHARTPEQQELCIQALETKCQILWAQLDAIHHAYVEPGEPPPGFNWNF